MQNSRYKLALATAGALFVFGGLTKADDRGDTFRGLPRPSVARRT